MSMFGRCLTGALIVAALSVGTWIAVSAQGRGEIKLNCQDTPCDAVARGRVAFNDRKLHGFGRERPRVRRLSYSLRELPALAGGGPRQVRGAPRQALGQQEC